MLHVAHSNYLLLPSKQVEAFWPVQILLSFATIWLSFRKGNLWEYSNFLLATKDLKLSPVAAIFDMYYVTSGVN